MIAYLIIILFIFFLYKLIQRLSSSFPIFELTVVLYLLQYGVTAMFQYSYATESYMSMAIGKNEYLSFIAFTCLAFTLGLFSVKQKIEIKSINISSQLASTIGRLLIVIGVVSDILVNYLPVGVHSIVSFFILFKAIGLYSLVFSNKKLDKILLVVFFIEIGLGAILNASLIEFIIFSVFFSMFFNLRYKISSKIKYTTVLLGMLFLTIYQSVKADYREYVWNNEVTFEAKIALLSDLITFDSFTAVFNNDLSENEALVKTTHRLNQGWQTSMVLNHVPQQVDFEYGSELMNDILSAFMPRFLWPNKRVVNDYQRFNHYTGYKLNKGTAMTLGVIGDFYLNFGFFGTIMAMFIFGHILSRLLRWFYMSFIIQTPINIIWIPFIFSYLIRPGNEFYMVINHLIKGLMVFYIMNKFIIPQFVQNQTHSKIKN